ncbi:MAG: glycosyltransferase family A protein [bacterium]
MPPRLTIAIPLHRAERWVENVCSVVEKAPEWSEVVVSDATHEDDALDQLQARLGGDPRVVFRPRAERLDWREHCNLLLAESESEYFCWMPQDDAVGPDDYFSLLVEALEGDPGAVLAFAPMSVPVRRGRGNPMRVRRNLHLPVPRSDVRRRETRSIDIKPPPTLALGKTSPEEEALLLLEHWPIGVAWRGVVRRSLARAIPANDSSDHTDSLWSFSIALAGRLACVEGTRYFKHYHETSAHQGFAPWAPWDQANLYRAEVEARLGAGSDRSEVVLAELEGFYRRRRWWRVKNAIGKIGDWIIDKPRIAVERA